MQEDRLPIGECVRLIRDAKGMTQAQLADLLGVDRGHLANYETGKRNIPADELWRFAEALGVPAAVFLDPRWGVVAAAKRQAVIEAQAIIAGITFTKKSGTESDDDQLTVNDIVTRERIIATLEHTLVAV